MAFCAPAATLQFEGVIGNSGPYDAPVQFAQPTPMPFAINGMGIVYDSATGRLFCRAGAGRLNAYSLDGRMLADYALPTDVTPGDSMVRAGQSLLMLIRGQLYTLPLNAPPKAEAKRLPMSHPDGCSLMSSSVYKDRAIAMLGRTNLLVWVNPADGKTELYGEFTPKHGGAPDGMDFDEAGNLYISCWRWMYKFSNGKMVEDGIWPKRFLGDREPGAERITRIGAYWYGGAWHGTIKRFSSDFEPAPGVVQGGAGGHFIGHVTINQELELLRGITEVKPGLFAIAGAYGTVLIARWNVAEQRLNLVRRIGSLPAAEGFGMDSSGAIFANSSVWPWSSGPATPSLFGMPPLGIGPAAYFTPDSPIIPGVKYGRNWALLWSALRDGRLRDWMTDEKWPGERQWKGERVIGTVLYPVDPRNPRGRQVVCAMAEDGTSLFCAFVYNDPNNCNGAFAPQIQLKAKGGVDGYTSITMKDPQTILAASDGALIEFSQSGDEWVETRRWNPNIGKSLKLAVSGNRLAIGSEGQSKLYIFDLRTSQKLAEIASPTPSQVAFNGAFIATYDAPGQRILKYKVSD